MQDNLMEIHLKSTLETALLQAKALTQFIETALKMTENDIQDCIE